MVGDVGASPEGLAVDDDFLLRHVLGRRPTGVRSLGIEPETAAEIAPGSSF
jgi:hypothetical protein